MEANKLLSIVLPTYNRAEFLDYSLEVHIPMAKKYNIAIYISDNASMDTTRGIVEKWMKEYPLLHYHTNEINVGAEKNFEIALKIPKTEYVWLLGDTYELPTNGIQHVLKCIEKEGCMYDCFVFNLVNKIQNIDCDYTEHNKLLADIGALMTCLSCLVFSQKLIQEANFDRYQDTYFIQMGIIFEYLAKQSFMIHWVQSESVKGLSTSSLSKLNWSHTNKALEIGCNKWANFVFSLPPIYTIENKMKCIMDFGKLSGLLTIKSLILLRALDIINIRQLQKYKHTLKLTVKTPIIILFGLCLIPSIFLKYLIFMFTKLMKKDRIQIIKILFKI